MYRALLNAFNLVADKMSYENREQNSTRLISLMLNFVMPPYSTIMNVESVEKNPSEEFTEMSLEGSAEMSLEENSSDFSWQILPQSVKAHVASFLNRREVTMLSRINKEENKNKMLFIFASLARNPEQIKTNDDLTMFIAQLLKLKHKDISHSERFETLMIQFIQKLEPQQTPFLTPTIDVTNQAHYIFVHANDRIAFQYKKLNKGENIAMAKVLGQYFSEADLRVVQLQQNAPYHISIDKKIFLQQILPWLFKAEGKPQKQIQSYEPKVIDYKEPGETKEYYYIRRKDGKPFTAEDNEKIYSITHHKGL
ncbi:hypothetical protein [Legionella cardiaca]|uniref:F-box domain-containing protein n=1 Tax=Legionella cardiaca TaxID=1071983 RepID=A0ABY8AT74_9GAMM|nr:hypothetical protein [Legionella cardiaca]WED42531.1 hypothetical protein PXX05_11510 [Legionella cardiaca]